MNVTCHVVTEGDWDRLLLERLLADELASKLVQIWNSHGYNAALSTARSLAAVRAVPVGLVLDADTINSEGVADRRSYLEEALGSAAASAPWSVFLAVPELEIIFYDAPGLVEELFGVTLNELQRELARVQPKRELEKLMPQRQITSRAQLLDVLSQEQILLLRDTPLVRDIRDFVQHAVSQPA
jgi:hypothetical protein